MSMSSAETVAPHAVVTGASSGIGLAVVRRLLAEGWCVTGIARRPVPDEGLSDSDRERLNERSVDLSDGCATEWLADDLAAQATPLHALVNCAGVNIRGPVSRASVGHFDYLHNVNLRAPYVLSSALTPHLESTCGTIVFVNSTQGLLAGADAVPYAASKHGLKALADGLRQELAGRARVASIYAGRTDTAGQRTILDHEGKRYVPERLIKASTVASLIYTALTLPQEAELVDLTVRTSQPI